MDVQGQGSGRILDVDGQGGVEVLENWTIFMDVICVLSLVSFKSNCCSTPSRLFIVGGTEITSREGTTQGDPVSMAIYGIGVTPLINMLIADILGDHLVPKS